MDVGRAGLGRLAPGLGPVTSAALRLKACVADASPQWRSANAAIRVWVERLTRSRERMRPHQSQSTRSEGTFAHSESGYRQQATTEYNASQAWAQARPRRPSKVHSAALR